MVIIPFYVSIEKVLFISFLSFKYCIQPSLISYKIYLFFHGNDIPHTKQTIKYCTNPSRVRYGRTSMWQFDKNQPVQNHLRTSSSRYQVHCATNRLTQLTCFKNENNTCPTINIQPVVKYKGFHRRKEKSFKRFTNAKCSEVTCLHNNLQMNLTCYKLRKFN